MRFRVIPKPGDLPAGGRATSFSRSSRILETCPRLYGNGELKRKQDLSRILTAALKKDHAVHLWRVNVLRGQSAQVDRPYLLLVKCPAEATQTERRDVGDPCNNDYILTCTAPNPAQDPVAGGNGLPRTGESLHLTVRHYQPSVQSGSENRPLSRGWEHGFHRTCHTVRVPDAYDPSYYV